MAASILYLREPRRQSGPLVLIGARPAAPDARGESETGDLVIFTSNHPSQVRFPERSIWGSGDRRCIYIDMRHSNLVYNSHIEADTKLTKHKPHRLNHLPSRCARARQGR
jgi:hypothetical protein